VDDDASFLRATARMLRASGYAVVIHDSAEEFLSSLDDGARGCVVTDLSMPGMDGLSLQAALAEIGSPMTVVFLSGHGNIPATVAAMKHGADDFLTKQAPREDLLAAIDHALKRGDGERAERQQADALRRQVDSLTKREKEVLRLVAQGLLNKQIADELGICDRTVKLHRTSVTSKLEVHSAAELALIARDAGLIEATFPKGQ
jgi:FixJ family two-component response regulator